MSEEVTFSHIAGFGAPDGSPEDVVIYITSLPIHEQYMLFLYNVVGTATTKSIVVPTDLEDHVITDDMDSLRMIATAVMNDLEMAEVMAAIGLVSYTATLAAEIDDMGMGDNNLTPEESLLSMALTERNTEEEELAFTEAIFGELING